MKRSAIFMQERSQEGQKRDFITHEQTIVCRQLFPVHVVGFQLIKWKKNLQQKITFEFPDKKKNGGNKPWKHSVGNKCDLSRKNVH